MLFREVVNAGRVEVNPAKRLSVLSQEVQYQSQPKLNRSDSDSHNSELPIDGVFEVIDALISFVNENQDSI